MYILLYVIVKVQMDSLKTSHCIHRQNAIGSIKFQDSQRTPVHTPSSHQTHWNGQPAVSVKTQSQSNCHSSPRLCSLLFKLYVITVIFYIRYIRCIGTTHLYIQLYINICIYVLVLPQGATEHSRFQYRQMYKYTSCSTPPSTAWHPRLSSAFETPSSRSCGTSKLP